MAWILNMRVLISCTILIILLISISTDGKKRKGFKSEEDQWKTCNSDDDCYPAYCANLVSTCVFAVASNKYNSINVCRCCGFGAIPPCAPVHVNLHEADEDECKESKKGQKCDERCQTRSNEFIQNYVCGGGHEDRDKHCYCGI